MKQSRFSDEQFVKNLREQEGEPVNEVTQRHAVSELTFPRRVQEVRPAGRRGREAAARAGT